MDFSEFRSKFQKVEVEHYATTVIASPLVSICVQTYQHVKYIGQCLDNILMQQTNFDFEILLGEDASTDGTREICIQYAQKFPDKIRLFLHHRENNIAIGGTPTGRFTFLYNIFSSRGTYVALCEGDDYWNDPLKLQRQVEFLNKSVAYVLSAENSLIDNSLSNTRYLFSDVTTEREIGTSDLIRGRKFHTASVVFRREALTLPDNIHEFPYGDTILFLALAKAGRINYSGKVSSVYRRHEAGMTGIAKWNWTQNVEVFNNMLNQFTEGKYTYVLKVNCVNAYYSSFKYYSKRGNLSLAFSSLIKGFTISPSLFFKKVFSDLSFHK